MVAVVNSVYAQSARLQQPGYRLQNAMERFRRYVFQNIVGQVNV